MATEMRKTGVDSVGDVVSWGAHFCLFYETKEDLLDGLISYCESGLESDELLPVDCCRALDGRSGTASRSASLDRGWVSLRLFALSPRNEKWETLLLDRVA
jgi:hypothetical protein